MRVIVVGAGIAGLAAARRLAASGVDVVVLEKEAYVGGRIKTDFLLGLPLDAGAQFLGNMYRNTNRLLRQAGLRQEVCPIKMCVDVVGREGTYPLCRHGHFMPYPSFGTLPWPRKIKLLKLAAFLLANRRLINMSDLSSGLALDDVSFTDWTEEYLDPDISRLYLDPVAAALFFQSGRDISRLIPLTLIKSPQRCGILTLSGGLGQLPLFLSKAVPVIKEARVRKAQICGTRVTLEVDLPSGKTTTLAADRVVFAIPPGELLPVLQGTDVLDAGSLAFLAESRFTSVAVTCLLLGQPMADEMYGYIFTGWDQLTSLSFRHHRGKPDSSGGIVTTASIISSGNLAEGTDLLEAAREIFPDLAERVVARRDYYWKYAIPCFPPGRIARIMEFTTGCRKSPVVSFCGDYLGGPGVEGAVSSGLRAAKQALSY